MANDNTSNGSNYFESERKRAPGKRQPERRFLFTLDHPSQHRPLTPREMRVLKLMCMREETDFSRAKSDALEIFPKDFTAPDGSVVHDCFDGALYAQIEAFQELMPKEIVDAEQLTRGSAPRQYHPTEVMRGKHVTSLQEPIGEVNGKAVYSVAHAEPAGRDLGAPPPYAPNVCMIHFNGLTSLSADELRVCLTDIPGVSEVQHRPYKVPYVPLPGEISTLPNR